MSIFALTANLQYCESKYIRCIKFARDTSRQIWQDNLTKEEKRKLIRTKKEIIADCYYWRAEIKNIKQIIKENT